MNGRYPSPSVATCQMEGNNNSLTLKLLLPLFLSLFFLSWASSSYEDWGVDELIVEDSWKRQVGGD